MIGWPFVKDFVDRNRRFQLDGDRSCGKWVVDSTDYEDDSGSGAFTTGARGFGDESERGFVPRGGHFVRHVLFGEL